MRTSYRVPKSFNGELKMSTRSLVFVAALLAAVPALGQAADPQAAQNSANWDIFL